MNTSPTKNGSSEYVVAATLDTENTFTCSSDIIISQITEYFQGRIAKDINDMAGHIINTLNSSRTETIASEDLCSELEKYKYIIKIQHSVIQITNIINNSHLNY